METIPLSRDWITDHPNNLKDRLPNIRLMDPRETGFRKEEPLVTISHCFAIWEHGRETLMMKLPGRFFTDAASIPRLLWPLVSPLDLGRTAFLFHDWLIKKKGQVPVYKWNAPTRCWVPYIGTGAKSWTREEVDRFFFRLMREEMEEWKLPGGNDWKSRIRRRWAIFTRKQRRRWAYRAVRSYVTIKTASGKGEW